MTTLLSRRKDALIFYRNLARRIGVERPTIETVREMVRGALEAFPLLLDDVEQLRRESEDQIWSMLRYSWGLAHIAYVTACDLHNDLLCTECELTLGSVLNTLGEYAGANLILERATKWFITNGRSERAVRSQCELAALYANMGKLDQAEMTLVEARTHMIHGNPLLDAYYDRAEGLLHFEQSRYPEAIEAFQHAADIFEASNRIGEVADTWCRLAEASRYINPQEALRWIEKARNTLTPDKETIPLARCDYILALISEQLNQYSDSLKLVQQARNTFAHEGMAHFIALCDLLQGYIQYDCDRFDEALQAYILARGVFASRSLESHVARCDLNMAIVYYVLDRYEEALALYERVVESAVREKRTLREAICYTNMGLCHGRLGHYDQALRFHQRAYHVLLNIGSDMLAARCQENLADIYRRLGRYSEALQHCQQERNILVRYGGLPVDIAACDLYTADVHLALSNYEQAVIHLEQARAVYKQANMAVQGAICDRKLARALTRIAQADQVHELLNHARAIFVQHNLLIDAILCDVAQGEVYLNEQRVAEAAPLFKSALFTLSPGFPDEAWRAEYGLGRCALIEDDRLRALQHLLRAIEMTNRIRAVLPTERLSGNFFADHHTLYEQALALALSSDQGEAALVVVEAARAQMFLSWTAQRSWRERASSDPYLFQLLDREEQLSRRLIALRDQLRVRQIDTDKPLTRDGEDPNQEPRDGLEKLTQLSHEYEDVVEQLRVQVPLQTSSYSLTPFSVQGFRQTVQRHLPGRWACLAYYWLGDQLVIFYLDERQLISNVKQLNSYERKILDQCTNPESDFRELIYGDLASSYAHFSHLYQMLIPPQVEHLGLEDLLIIVPHAQLHALPFHALQGRNGPLVNQVTTVITPSLSALEILLREAGAKPSLEHVLTIGLSDFGNQTRSLPSARNEIEALAALFGDRLKGLRDTQATLGTLKQLGQTDELAKYDIIHFATHAVLDHLAPSQSRILLHNSSLACTDIMNLKFCARLVVLASCQGALGHRYAGDEVMGLAQAFFFAGARAVVASLWPVEDSATTELMRRFYSRLDAGCGVAQALCIAQSEMAHAGYTPYQWAPFVVIGAP